VAKKAAAAATEGHATLAEWAVLGLLGCGPQHAFAIVKSLARGGEFGRIWAVPTPVVYRAVNTLREDGLIEVVGEERSDAGPPRTLLSITRTGKRRLDAWLNTPVTHMRDVRSELMLKLAFLARMRRSAAPLVEAQAEAFAPMLKGLQANVKSAEGDGSFDVALSRWRLESARAVMRFLDVVSSAEQRPPG
jgi:PadR family transcriptional regulator AphA